jgi:hypothetical protein
LDKSKLNLVIDAAMFLCLMALAGLGFLMKYVLPSGRDAWAKYGSNLQRSWLGWDRHDWGDIHLYLAFAFLSLLVFHIILHWHRILGLFRRVVPDSRRRYRIALIFLFLSLLLIYFPFLINPDSKSGGRGGHRSQVDGADARVAVDGPAGAGGQPPIVCTGNRGFRVAPSPGVPCEDLKSDSAELDFSLGVAGISHPHRRLRGVSGIHATRGWRGFHHHATLCIAAYGFLVAERSSFPLSGPDIRSAFTLPQAPEGWKPRGSSPQAGAA